MRSVRTTRMWERSRRRRTWRNATFAQEDIRFLLRGPGRLEVEAEAGLEFAAAEAGDGEGSAVVFAGEPLAGEGKVE